MSWQRIAFGVGVLLLGWSLQVEGRNDFGYEYYEKDGELIIIDKLENRSYKFQGIKSYDNFRVRMGVKNIDSKSNQPSKKEREELAKQDAATKLEKLRVEANDLYYRGKLAKCLEVLKAMEELAPNDYQVKTMLGSVYFATEDKDKAKQYWRESLKLNPAQPDIVAKLKSMK